MKRSKQTRYDGFTIIEVLLFLGVSSLLAMGIITSVGASINQQRYRDSVNSLASTLQQQFNEVTNSRNIDRPTGLQCSSSAVISDTTTPSASDLRGRSECVLLGRYVRTRLDSGVTQLHISTVIGREINAGLTSNNDIDALSNYNMNILRSQTEVSELRWSNRLTQEGSTADHNFALLILRSPLSGGIRAFTTTTMNNVGDNDHGISNIVTNANASLSQRLCVDSNDLFSGPKQSVTIESNASSATAISVFGDDDAC